MKENGKWLAMDWNRPSILLVFFFNTSALKTSEKQKRGKKPNRKTEFRPIPATLNSTSGLDGIPLGGGFIVADQCHRSLFLLPSFDGLFFLFLIANLIFIQFLCALNWHPSVKVAFR